MSFCYPEGNFGGNQLLAFNPSLNKTPTRLSDVIVFLLMARLSAGMDYTLSTSQGSTDRHLVSELHS